MFLATALDTARLWPSEWIWPTPRWIRRNFPDQGGDGATKNQILATKAETPRLSRPRRKWRDSSEQGGEGATFQTNAETALPRKISPRPLWIRGDPSYQGGDGLTFQTKTESAHFFKPKGRCHDFPDRDKYGASKKVSLRPRWIHSIPGWRLHHFPERGGDGATKKTFLAAAVDTTRPSYQGGDGLTFQAKTASAHFFKPKGRCRDFPDRDKYGATKKVSLRPRWMRRDFPDEGGTARPFRPRRKRRDVPDHRGNGAT